MYKKSSTLILVHQLEKKGNFSDGRDFSCSKLKTLFCYATKSNLLICRSIVKFYLICLFSKHLKQKLFTGQKHLLLLTSIAFVMFLSTLTLIFLMLFNSHTECKLIFLFDFDVFFYPFVLFWIPTYSCNTQ